MATKTGAWADSDTHIFKEAVEKAIKYHEHFFPPYAATIRVMYVGPCHSLVLFPGYLYC
jgi:hypothetical protein